MRALIFLLLLSLLTIFACDEIKTENETLGTENKTVEEPAKEETEEEINARKLREDIKKALDDMGAAEAETITKEQFKLVFSQVMNKGDEEQMAQAKPVFEIILGKMLKKVPDVIPVGTIQDYFSPRSMAEVFTEYLSDLGADYDLVSMVDDYDEKKKEGKSHDEIVNELEEDLIKKEKIKEQQNWFKDDKDKGEGDL